MPPIADPADLLETRVRIFWPGDKTYYAGKVVDYNKEADTHGILCKRPTPSLPAHRATCLLALSQMMTANSGRTA